MNKFTKIRVPILNDEYAVYVIWGDEKKRLKFLRYHFDDDSITNYEWDNNRATTHMRNRYAPVINIHNTKYFYSELAHEACHAIDDIFSYIHDDNRGELFAHSVGAIVRTVERFKKHGK